MEEEMEVRIKWCSGGRGTKAGKVEEEDGREGEASGDMRSAIEMKGLGNDAVKAGEYKEAIRLYTEALAVLTKGKTTTENSGQMLASLYANRSHAKLRTGENHGALSDAEKAVAAEPSWSKGHYRLAQAGRAVGAWDKAVRACEKGMASSSSEYAARRDFQTLLDEIALESFQRGGSLAGFRGRKLEVRHAGEDAWLGLPAPEDPLLDGEQENDTPSAPLQLSEGVSDAVSLGVTAVDRALKKAAKTSFRSLKDAVEAACDGDVITMQRGTHNIGGEAIEMTKRVLLRGRGTLEETTLDQRANAPTLRITRSCVVQNLCIELTGFRECINVTGNAKPLIDRCVVSSSGSDGITCSHKARPHLRDSNITAKHCGVLAFGLASPTLHKCTLSKCGAQSVRAMEESEIRLTRCLLRDGSDDGIVAMERSRLHLDNCTVQGHKGVAIDISDSAAVEFAGGTIAENVGGVWLWDDGCCSIIDSDIHGGTSHTLMSSCSSHCTVRQSHVRGHVECNDSAHNSVDSSNLFLRDEYETSLPPEVGPFRFVPDPYKRKQ